MMTKAEEIVVIFFFRNGPCMGGNGRIIVVRGKVTILYKSYQKNVCIKSTVLIDTPQFISESSDRCKQT